MLVSGAGDSDPSGCARTRRHLRRLAVRFRDAGLGVLTARCLLPVLCRPVSDAPLGENLTKVEPEVPQDCHCQDSPLHWKLGTTMPFDSNA